MYAYLFGTILHYLVKRDAVIEAFKRRLVVLAEYCELRGVSSELQLRIKNYLIFQFEFQAGNDEELVSKLPQSVRTKVCSYKYGKVVQNSLLGDCDAEFLRSLMVCLREAVLMPAEQFARIRDIGWEIGFIQSGMCEITSREEAAPGAALGAQKPLRVVVRDDFSKQEILGLIPFITGIRHQYGIRASKGGQVKLLSLRRSSYEELQDVYPEQHALIFDRILHDLGLDTKGEDLPGLGVEEDSGETTQLREAVRAVVMSKHESQLGEMIFASSTGDLALVKKLVREGLDIDSGDYDMRTTLHVASAEGSIAVIKCLLEEGANPNVEDRWGNNPIQDTLNGRHFDAMQALLKAGGTITIEDSAELMCKAAAAGEIELMRNLVSFGVSVNVGDYDNRTAMHLASAEGTLKVALWCLVLSVTCKDVSCGRLWSS